MKFFNVYLWESVSRGGAERGGHRIRSRLQAPKLSAQSPTPGLNSQTGAWTHRLWDHDLSWSQMLNRLSHQGIPVLIESQPCRTILFLPLSYGFKQTSWIISILNYFCKMWMFNNKTRVVTIFWWFCFFLFDWLKSVYHIL